VRPRLLAALAVVLALACAAPAAALDLKRDDVKGFIDEVCARDHFKRAWVAKILGAAEIRQAIIDLENRPAERVRAWYEYRAIFVTDKRIRDGREFMAQHRAELEAAASGSGVPAEIIAAIIGVETSYGRIVGPFREIDALSTLAFAYPPRAQFYRGELEQFLLLVREAKFDPLAVMGSYGGALGVPQFIPSNYRSLAVDADRDGRVDLWNSWPDIFGSVAHYFVVHGWHTAEPIVAAAELWYPGVAGLPAGHLELNESVGSLHAKGVLFVTTLAAEAPAVFLALREPDGPGYRVGFHNFSVITRYNHSNLYALAVVELAAALAAPAPAEPPAAPHAAPGAGP
jgi:membrane-bound lytic murein transglycosylase B